jgi:hypothetical protein
MDPVKPLPPIGSLDYATAKKAIEDGLYYDHPLYARWRSTWRRAELYDQGLQWLQKGPAAFDGPGYLSQWASIYYEPADPNFIPTPVFNEGHGARINESARIGRPNYRPVVRPKAEIPTYTVKQAAKRATDALRHRLREMGWDKQAYTLYYHIPVYGGAWLKSEWEQTWDKTTPVPVPEAVGCPNSGGGMSTRPAPVEAPNVGEEFNDPAGGSGTPEGTVSVPDGREPCPFVLSSANIPMEMAGKASWIGSELAPGDDETGSFVALQCPLCPDHPTLVPFQPTLSEAATGKDALGRPLGTAQPLGDWQLKVASPYDVHVRNLGFMQAPGEIKEWREVHVETLDWVALHYPEKAAKVKPDRPDIIAKYHPILGAPDVYGSILDARILRDSVRVMEWHREPWMELTKGPEGNSLYRLNQGRSIVIAGGEVLLDGPYMLDSLTEPGKKVPRVRLDYIPWEIKDGGRYVQGMSLWELLFDPQDNVNEIRSQAQSVRQRMALPLYVALKSHNLEMSTRDGVPGRIAFIDVDPEAPSVLPQIMNNTTIAPGAWEELRDTITSLEKYAGNVEVEKGQVPPNVQAALAIQYLKSYAGEKREPRIARIKEALRRMWLHGLQLMQAFYLEPREVSYENELGEERWTTVEGHDLAGETHVTVESEADFDDRARNQELVMSLIERGVIQPAQDPALAREVARVLEAPESLFEVQDIQRDGAQREYVEFTEKGAIPVVDPTLDDHLVHFRQHGIDAHSDAFRELEERAGWDEALKILGATWDMDLNQLMMIPAPVCLQERIFGFWKQKLAMAAQPQMDPMTGLPIGPPLYAPAGDEEALNAVLRWRAHSEEHRLYEQMRQVQAMMTPTVAAPGGAATAEGGQPAPGQPPA